MRVSNEISYMQKHGALNRIMQSAIKSQTENLRRRKQQAIEAAARKSKMKAWETFFISQHMEVPQVESKLSYLHLFEEVHKGLQVQ